MDLSILPTENAAPVHQNPRKLFFFGHTKLGKTEMALQLKNSLLIDLEDSADFYGGQFVNIRKWASQKKTDMISGMREVIMALHAQKAANNNIPKYDYLIIDSSTELEDMAKDLAAQMYKATAQGKSWTGTDITTLPNGAGYNYIRMAFEKLYDSFEGLYNKCLVLIGHVKSASIMKNGMEMQAKDINLQGKLKFIVSAQMDAIGYLYRKQNSNENILSFKTNEQDLATGSRCQHLAGKDFLISEKMPDGTLKTHWDKIFLA